MKSLLYSFLFWVGLSCAPPTSSDYGKVPEFNEYWYQGKAELTSYQLEQARYGAIHQGHAVLIFVTEPFSLSKHVKPDRPQQTHGEEVSVLKLNFTKKFTTGLYPYSMMASMFTPVEIDRYPNTLKVSSSSQEWCGHTFTQLNLEKNRYRGQLYSYFESEGDQEIKLTKVVLEDEIWNRIRINPQSLPTGTVQMIPGTFYTRLRHQSLAPQTVEASLSVGQEGAVSTYVLKYPAFERTLQIHFQSAFPYEIVGWEESYPSGFGSNAKLLTTKARKKKQLVIDYWNKNQPLDARLRKELDLPE
ncbi:hypothetical protein AAG747_18120 [Rapidithrix thailandica]|uniref:Septum formation inhibitor Maf n=1 Tax=Rapidithrix thailandica TaxID=413964 RepID=A0AAW9S8M2_9BACT